MYTAYSETSKSRIGRCSFSPKAHRSSSACSTRYRNRRTMTRLSEGIGSRRKDCLSIRVARLTKGSLSFIGKRTTTSFASTCGVMRRKMGSELCINHLSSRSSRRNQARSLPKSTGIWSSQWMRKEMRTIESSTSRDCSTTSSSVLHRPRSLAAHLHTCSLQKGQLRRTLGRCCLRILCSVVASSQDSHSRT